MPIFKSTGELKDILGGFFNELIHNEGIRSKLLESKLVIKFSYRNPQASITVDASGPEIEITYDDAQKVPVVEMAMKADVAHQFWLGRVNLVLALARRQMTAKGPIPKILKLLPVIKPAYKLYPEYLVRKGYGNLVGSS